MIRYAVLLAGAAACAAQPNPKISIVAEGALGPAARHGLGKLESALKQKRLAVETVAAAKARGDLVVVARVSGDAAPAGAESLEIRRSTHRGKPSLELSGGGDRGLMYALLDVADRVGWAKDGAQPFSEVREVKEKPAVGVRALSIYTMNAAWFESRLHNEEHWRRYFDLLARNRFNAFVVVFGYENAGYMAPAYPYFFDVEGFPDVRVEGLTKERQTRNLQALRRMIALAHERGIGFGAGLWDHIYRGGVQGPVELTRKPTPGLVWGVNEKNLTTYIPAAFARFLKEFPDIDVVQFRMHGESGLEPSEMRGFWEAMYQVMKQAPRTVSFEFRLKDFPDDLIDRAVELRLPFRLATKYWAEQMAMPFHPTHIQRGNQFDRRHSFADVLRYPKRYEMNWRLWSGGTTRVLLWGSPEWVRRFAGSTHLYGGAGFEVNEPLATKMERAPVEMAPYDLLRPQYRYYDYEFERYWHYYQVFGRIGYNPATPSEIWEHEFQARFGVEAGPLLERALHKASWILPRIMAYSMPPGKFPTTRGWAERQRWEDLPVYARSVPGDTQQFESFEEAVSCRMKGDCTPKTRLDGTSRWFDQAAEEVLSLVEQAERKAGAARSKEFVSTATDLRMLAALARYHARRIPAGVSYALFAKTRDAHSLDDAIAHERRAIEAWEGLVSAAGDVYTENLVMGIASFDLAGHWKDELGKLRAGLAALETQSDGFRPEVRRPAGRFVFGDAAAKEGERRLPGRYSSEVALPNGSYELMFTLDGSAAASDSGYGPMWIEANGTDYTEVFRVPRGAQAQKRLTTTVEDGTLDLAFGAEASGTWRADRMEVTRVDPVIHHVPVRRRRPGQDLEIRATIAGTSAAVSARVVYGGREGGYRGVPLEQRGPARYRALIPAAQAAPGLRYWIEARDEAGRLGVFPAGGAAHPIEVAAGSDEDGPTVDHERVARARAGQPLRVKARVTDPSGVRWVRLRYRAVNQHQDFRTLPLLATEEKDEYAAEVPASHIDSKWDFMYLIEAMDSAGNGKIYPDIETETPYIVVGLER